ncbi:MAG: hypothetical protein ACLRMJ_01605 [Alistipes finegoldii]
MGNPRGHRRDRRAGQHLRLCVERRIVLDRRPRRSIIMELIGKGYKADGKGATPTRGIVWVAPHSRQICFGARQSGASRPSKNDRKPLRARRRFIRAKWGITTAPMRVQLLRRVRRSTALRACETRLGLLPHGADDMDRYADCTMGHNAANRMPLWVMPAKKCRPKRS